MYLRACSGIRRDERLPTGAAGRPPARHAIRSSARSRSDCGRSDQSPNVIGYTLGVVTRNGLAWSKTYGAANVETAYGIGASPFTAIMLLQLVRDGKVHFSDRVETYVPELQTVPGQYPDASPVTLLQLALHTSGLTLDSKEIYPRSAAADWEEALLAALPRINFEFEPGTHAALSNVDDAILALALARAAHQPYTEYLRQRILLPLGMSHTESASLGYRPVLFTTIGDLARFASFEMLGGPDSVPLPQGPGRELPANLGGQFGRRAQSERRVRHRLRGRNLDQQPLLLHPANRLRRPWVRGRALVRTPPARGRDSAAPGPRRQRLRPDDPQLRLHAERAEERCRTPGACPAVSLYRRGSDFRQRGRRHHTGGHVNSAGRQGSVPGRDPDSRNPARWTATSVCSITAPSSSWPIT